MPLRMPAAAAAAVSAADDNPPWLLRRSAGAPQPAMPTTRAQTAPDPWALFEACLHGNVSMVARLLEGPGAGAPILQLPLPGSACLLPFRLSTGPFGAHRHITCLQASQSACFPPAAQAPCSAKGLRVSPCSTPPLRCRCWLPTALRWMQK